jgi:hypothetical protein
VRTKNKKVVGYLTVRLVFLHLLVGRLLTCRYFRVWTLLGSRAARHMDKHAGTPIAP